MSVHRETAAHAALLLAHWWSRPTTDELDAWDRVWGDARATAGALDLGASAVDDLRLAAKGADPDALCDEYERLLNGPGRAPCAPYESLWREDLPAQEQGMLMSSAAEQVETVYRTLGLKLRAEPRELPDHLVVEWEALAYAVDRDATDESGALLSDHLACWMAPFCRAVTAATDQPFYAKLARLTPAWTAALAG
jgi:TorA maturation chaperone TorD